MKWGTNASNVLGTFECAGGKGGRKERDDAGYLKMVEQDYSTATTEMGIFGGGGGGGIRGVSEKNTRIFPGDGWKVEGGRWKVR